MVKLAGSGCLVLTCFAGVEICLFVAVVEGSSSMNKQTQPQVIKIS